MLHLRSSNYKMQDIVFNTADTYYLYDDRFKIWKLLV